jgi:Leucine-rich repeat (LRR) protein
VLSVPLAAVPAELLQLRGLQHLCLRSCGLRALPAAITSLASLRALVLTDNDVKALPKGGPLRAPLC